jgi:hypothetical protein
MGLGFAAVAIADTAPAKHKPSPAQFKACAKSKASDACTFKNKAGKEITGTCEKPKAGGDKLFCKRPHAGGAGSGSGSGSGTGDEGEGE